MRITRNSLRKIGMTTDEKQIGMLAKFLMEKFPEEMGRGPNSSGESIVEMAIRLLTQII